MSLGTKKYDWRRGSKDKKELYRPSAWKRTVKYQMTKWSYISEKHTEYFAPRCPLWIEEGKSAVLKIRYERSEDVRPGGRLTKGHVTNSNMPSFATCSWNLTRPSDLVKISAGLMIPGVWTLSKSAFSMWPVASLMILWTCKLERFGPRFQFYATGRYDKDGHFYTWNEISLGIWSCT